MNITYPLVNQRRRPWLMLLVSLCIAGSVGCVTHRHTLTGTPRRATDAADVRIYLEPLTAPYEEIALLEATSSLSWAVTPDARTDVVLKRLQREAAALGANGILLQDMSTGDSAAGVGVGSDVTRDHAAFGLSLTGLGAAKVGRGTAIFVATH